MPFVCPSTQFEELGGGAAGRLLSAVAHDIPRHVAAPQRRATSVRRITWHCRWNMLHHTRCLIFMQTERHAKAVGLLCCPGHAAGAA